MKNLTKINDVKVLSKSEQKSIKGGKLETCIHPSFCKPDIPQMPCPGDLVMCMIYPDY